MLTDDPYPSYQGKKKLSQETMMVVEIGVREKISGEGGGREKETTVFEL